MPIPPEFNDNVSQWFSSVLGNLSNGNQELRVLVSLWDNFTPTQKGDFVAMVQQIIADGIVSLQAVSMELGNLA